MENSGKENEELAQSTLKTEEEQLPVEQSPENECSEEEQSSEDLSSEEQSSEEEYFSEELLPELVPDVLVWLDRPPQDCLPHKDLFEGRAAMEQPPCGVGKHKLEEGSFKERLSRLRPKFRGVFHGRNLSNEEMIQAADELEEMKRVRNKLMIMHWKERRSRPYLI
ncbi:transcription elongation factor A protein-like 1 [Arvicola amphibius]|uniref:transcription elongation factor A protein-like 1 n=1 Tax=Arvicola amphibius TaxID=1047088 RepID=UPI0018E2BA99|nr:transcription elongation factor A protein-like 1 [Arvicola amphibius]XP_038173002.1 transcription elongation factor A protein-like 1 [Arvicola amphibius]XP_038173003.1 transcription elongation factor A protein-like 1 [Arvicola amphibius]XP_038173004.1 transcription elongation factor A protein-like 1 [Arvicola amphibius]XP_038173006.1 transcription elongation factor A protein-like 1 [Arvicola amphibius]XP_038173007.1 transcription elongation factor A protein-like 1 [Arvicola amphibius]XP_03